MKIPTLTTKQKLIAPLGVVLALMLMFGLRTNVSAEELQQRALEAKIKAMEASCETIGKKISSCYSGNRTLCSQVQESIAWFSNEYGQYPELACSTDNPFFLKGV